MFVKRILQKATHHNQQHNRRQNNGNDYLTASDLDPRITVHYGMPHTSSILAFDPIQRLLAIGTLDGRIKVIGGDNIEGLLISPKQLPYKYLEFLQNQGVLVSISKDNYIQVWTLENRSLAFSLQWESNITAFSVLCGSHFMYVGDEYGTVSVLKYKAEDEVLLPLPYQLSAKSITDAAGVSFSNHPPIVGILSQPCSSGNRLLIALESGLIILWDVLEAQTIMVRGDKVLQLKDGLEHSSGAVNGGPMEYGSEHSTEKEISALCWASSNGSVLAVGYIDGDILFWKTSTASSKVQEAELSHSSVVKLQLSSAEKKLPVIVLHWSASHKSQSHCDGKLFIYGGDEIGSEEVITVLCLEWSSRMETLRCVGRLEVTLAGSFADMILLPDVGPSSTKQDPTIFVLTNPGQLQAIDSTCFAESESQQDIKKSVSIVDLPSVIPTIVPFMTMAKLFALPIGGKFSTALSEVIQAVSVKKLGSTPTLSGVIGCPITGGILNHLSFTENKQIGRVYIAGYGDGSVRIWDATYPVLSLLCVLEGELNGIKVDGSSAPVTKVDFCFVTSNLAVGNEWGVVRLYSLNGHLHDTNFHLVVNSTHEVHNLPQSEGLNCKAIFNLLKSPVRTLDFTSHGAKLAVGYECGHVAVVDMSTFSALFVIESVAVPDFPLISVIQTAFKHNDDDHFPKDSGSIDTDNQMKELIFILTKDAKVFVIDAHTGKMPSSKPMHLKESIAISMYVIDGNIRECEPFDKKQQQQTPEADVIMNESSCEKPEGTSHLHENVYHPSSECARSQGSLKDSLVLLCCKDALRVYPMKSVVLGNKKSICKVKLAMPCLWTTTFLKDGKVSGLVLFYQTGVIEIRSLPDLELVIETSSVSLLRWNLKEEMHRTFSSSENGHITLACGSEVAFISLLASENDFRIPESLPCLHDKVLAAAAESAITFSSNQNKNVKGVVPGILGGIVKGLKGGKVNHAAEFVTMSKSNFSHLEHIFSRNPFPDSSPSTADNQDAIELDIDDIEIDEPSCMASTSYNVEQSNEREKATEREKLFDGESSDAKPKLRTREEIIAKYRKAGDVSSVAGQAKDKLLERQEKLERISQRTEDLRNGAEDFASLANELVKTMENKKWWQI